MSTEKKNIIVALKAKLGKFSKKMRAAGARIKAFAKTAKQKLAKAGKVFAVVFAAISAAIAAAVVKITAVMDATGKLSDRLKITTKNLTALNHSAQLNGVANLNKNLEGYVKRIGEALEGTGTAVRALDKLKISAEFLQPMDLDAQLLYISDAFKQIPDRAVQASIAADLFGRSGMDMATMLRQGSAAIRENMTEAEQLGITYNRSQAAAAESAQDSMLRIKASFKAMVMRIVIRLLPRIEAGLKKLVQWFKENGDWIMEIVNGVVDVVVAAWRALSGIFTAGLGVMRAGMSAFGVNIKSNTEAIKIMFKGMVRVIQWVAEAIIRGLTRVEVFIENWRKHIELGGASLLYIVIKVANTFEYWFTKVIPKYIKWAFKNWQNLIVDFGVNLVRTLANVGKNIAAFGAAIKNAVTGKGFTADFVSLADGWQDTTSALPDIAEREIGKLEKYWLKRIGKLGLQIETAYQTKLKARIDALYGRGEKKQTAKKNKPWLPLVKWSRYLRNKYSLTKNWLAKTTKAKIAAAAKWYKAEKLKDAKRRKIEAAARAKRLKLEAAERAKRLRAERLEKLYIAKKAELVKNYKEPQLKAAAQSATISRQINLRALVKTSRANTAEARTAEATERIAAAMDKFLRAAGATSKERAYFAAEGTYGEYSI